MNKRTWFGMTVGVSISAMAIAGWRLYQQRPIERVPSQEGIEDPAAAQAYGRIMRFPQVALLRKYIAGRAARLMSTGAAADLGCGPGYLAIELARNAPDLYVTGVDLSDAMLAQAISNARLADVAHQTDFRTGDVAALPFRDASLDLVVSTLSLHHWGDPRPVFDEVARVSAPRRRVLALRPAPRPGHRARAAVLACHARCRAADAAPYRGATGESQRCLHTR